jgi:membrane protease YdiL (CAAX protease family)
VLQLDFRLRLSTLSRTQELVAAVTGAALLVPATIAIWYVTLIANLAVSPSIPWFVVLDLLGLFGLFRYLKSQDLLSSSFALQPASKRALVFGVTGMVACYCLAVIEGAFGGMRLGPLIEVASGANNTSVTAVLVLPVYAGISEEMIFRGALQTRLARTFGPVVAIALTTILFLGVHLQRSDFVTQWMFFAMLSIVLGTIASRLGSVPLCIVLHAGTNFVSVAVTWWFGPFLLANLRGWVLVPIACLGIACALLALASLRVTRPAALRAPAR